MFELAAAILGTATAGIVGSAGARWWALNRRWQRFKTRVAAQHATLEEWAKPRGWRIGDGADFRLIELADNVAGLAGVPGDWDIKPGEEAGEVRITRWQFGTVLAQETPHGRLVLGGCWRDDDDGREHRIFASLSTDGVFAPFTLDRLSGGRLHREGAPPIIDDGRDVDDIIEGFGVGARLRFLADRILLTVPGWMPPETAEMLAALLVDLHKRLPRRPQLGPLR